MSSAVSANLILSQCANRLQLALQATVGVQVPKEWYIECLKDEMSIVTVEVEVTPTEIRRGVTSQGVTIPQIIQDVQLTLDKGSNSAADLDLRPVLERWLESGQAQENVAGQDGLSAFWWTEIPDDDDSLPPPPPSQPTASTSLQGGTAPRPPSLSGSAQPEPGSGSLRNEDMAADDDDESSGPVRRTIRKRKAISQRLVSTDTSDSETDHRSQPALAAKGKQKVIAPTRTEGKRKSPRKHLAPAAAKRKTQKQKASGTGDKGLRSQSHVQSQSTADTNVCDFCKTKGVPCKWPLEGSSAKTGGSLEKRACLHCASRKTKCVVNGVEIRKTYSAKRQVTGVIETPTPRAAKKCRLNQGPRSSRTPVPSPPPAAQATPPLRLPSATPGSTEPIWTAVKDFHANQTRKNRATATRMAAIEDSANELASKVLFVTDQASGLASLVSSLAGHNKTLASSVAEMKENSKAMGSRLTALEEAMRRLQGA